jgi:hypothetical protein
MLCVHTPASSHSGGAVHIRAHAVILARAEFAAKMNKQKAGSSHMFNNVQLKLCDSCLAQEGVDGLEHTFSQRARHPVH